MWLCLATASQADEAAWRIWLEPRFMHTPVTHAIPGAQKTEITAGTWDGTELTPVTKEGFGQLGVDWEKFAATARSNANGDLGKLTPRYVRNRRNIIVYAALESKTPLVSSAVIAPKFLDLFRETMGEKFLVVVPNRYIAYVFPSLASDYQDYWPMVFEAYRATAFPVSVEVFEVSQNGLRAVGLYQEP